MSAKLTDAAGKAMRTLPMQGIVDSRTRTTERLPIGDTCRLCAKYNDLSARCIYDLQPEYVARRRCRSCGLYAVRFLGKSIAFGCGMCLRTQRIVNEDDFDNSCWTSTQSTGVRCGMTPEQRTSPATIARVQCDIDAPADGIWGPKSQQAMDVYLGRAQIQPAETTAPNHRQTKTDDAPTRHFVFDDEDE